MKKITALFLSLIILLQTTAFAEGNVIFSGVVDVGAKKYISALIIGCDADMNNITGADIRHIAQTTVGDDGSYSISVPMEALTSGNTLLSNVRLKDISKYEYIYVSQSEACANPNGSEEAPYSTLSAALAVAKAENIIVLMDMQTFSSQNLTGPAGGVVVTGEDPKTGKINGGIDFETNEARMGIGCDITFENMTLKTHDTEEATRIYARGYKLVMGEGLTMTNPINIYGGASGSANTVESTDITLISGTYNRIFGGGIGAAVAGDTHITVEGEINKGYSAYDTDSNKLDSRIFGGGTGSNSTVGGNTYIDIQDGNIMYVFGAGEKSDVAGDTYINISGGNIMNAFGGTSGTVELNSNSHVNMTGGTIEAIFGGSHSVNFNGNTSVAVTGGTVKRRVYGGCYNNYSLSGYASSGGVTGTSAVAIGSGATLPSKSSGFDNVGIFASDRYSSRKSGANAVLIFLDNCYESVNSKIGEQKSTLLPFYSNHNYIVKVSAGGIVESLGDCKLSIIPEIGKAALINGQIYKDEYTLSAAETVIEFVDAPDDSVEIEVTDYEVKSGYADIEASVNTGAAFVLSENDRLIAAIYDSDDRFINAQHVQLTSDKNYNFNINLEGESSIYRIRLFVWNMNSLLPLSNEFVLTLN